MNSITAQITKRIRLKKRGWVFRPKDFLDLGPRTAVDQVLSRLVRQGFIRRLDRGIYDYPKQHSILGDLSPDSASLAQAVSAKSGDKVFPSGAMAANLLGLSTQVPAKTAYLTNGSSRTREIGGRTITLKHARLPLLNNLSDKVNLTLQALAYLGKDNIDDQVIRRCASQLNDRDMRGLVTAIVHVPGWMANIILRIKQIQHGSICNQA